MIVIGIDPGKHGGIVVLSEKGQIIEMLVMPEDLIEAFNFINEYQMKREPIIVYMEDAQAMPGNGVVSMFNFGYHNGQLDMLLRLASIPYVKVHSTQWTKIMHVDTAGDRPKERSKQVIKRLQPDVCFRNPNSRRARTIHEGLMDAYLIAEFGRRQLEHRSAMDKALTLWKSLYERRWGTK